MIDSPLFRPTVFALAAAVLSACGSGGGSSATPLTAAPATSISTTPTAPISAAPVSASPSTPPTAASTLKTAQLNGAAGFVAPNGRTIYIFDADLAVPGRSACNNQCAVDWPPLAPPANVSLTTGFAAIKRNDGTMQLTYNSRPLYLFLGDSGPGTANGDGITAFGGLWHVSRPAGSSAGSSPNPPPAGSY